MSGNTIITQAEPHSSSPYRTTLLLTARNAVQPGTAGIYLSGLPGADRTQFLNSLLASLAADQVMVVRLDSEVSPQAFGHVLESVERDSVWRTALVLVVVDDADQLRRDTLDLMEQSATSLLAGEEGPQMLLVGQASLEKRLLTNQLEGLGAYLRTRLTLDPVAADRLTTAPLSSQGMDRRGRTRRRTVLGGKLPIRQAVAAACVTIVIVAGAATLLLTSGADILADRTGAKASTPVLRMTAIAPPPDRIAPVGADPIPVQTVPAPPATAADIAAKGAVAAPASVPGPVPKIAEVPPAPLADANPAAIPAQEAAAAPYWPSGGPGLLLVAGQGDTLAKLYHTLYSGVAAPPFAAVLAANPGPVQPGKRLMFPTPPGGWLAHAGG